MSADEQRIEAEANHLELAVISGLVTVACFLGLIVTAVAAWRAFPIATPLVLAIVGGLGIDRLDQNMKGTNS